MIRMFGDAVRGRCPIAVLTKPVAGSHAAPGTGFVVDLGGWQAVANPLRLPLSGAPAKILTHAYHLYALPGNRPRVATDWFNDIVEHHQFVAENQAPRR